MARTPIMLHLSTAPPLLKRMNNKFRLSAVLKRHQNIMFPLLSTPIVIGMMGGLSLASHFGLATGTLPFVAAAAVLPGGARVVEGVLLDLEDQGIIT